MNDLPIVNVRYSYDRPDTGEVLILELNHCIYMGNRKNDSIACPNQLRANNIYIDDRPLQFYPSESDTQCIRVDGITLPLRMHGPLSYLPIRRPTLDEMSDDRAKRLTK